MHPVLTIVSIYFIVGALGTALAARRQSPEVRKARWLKFVVYVVLVYGLIAVMLYWRAQFWLPALTIVAGSLWELYKVRRQAPLSTRFYQITGLVFGLAAAGFMRMAHSFDSPKLLFVFLIVFCFDGFCQIFGQLLGRRKLFPRVSPNKTVEGLAGGTLSALATAVLTRDWVDLNMLPAAAYGLALSAAALSGDWLASYYKRRHGVKDFSRILPGHGGFLDRFDSWLLAGAVAGLWL
ncbi:MAG: phosphatidate cytidylyltransferase [Saprospiraceae bacterium]|nr:phosphatidate cytidylyltransferase [Saprospiraceae bacterium]